MQIRSDPVYVQADLGLHWFCMPYGWFSCSSTHYCSHQKCNKFRYVVLLYSEIFHILNEKSFLTLFEGCFEKMGLFMCVSSTHKDQPENHYSLFRELTVIIKKSLKLGQPYRTQRFKSDFPAGRSGMSLQWAHNLCRFFSHGMAYLEVNLM